jgi:predicted anti-sigma-YlaC factor YlaD
MRPLNCDEARIDISSKLDGEPVVDDDELRAHVGSCRECARFEREAGALRASARAPVAVEPTGVVDRVLSALEPDRSTSPESKFLRVLLGVVGIVGIVQSVPDLFAPGDGVNAHASRHLGVFMAALAVGFVYTALRPRRIGGLLPVAAVLSAGLVVTAVIDVASGRTPLVGETAHIVEIVGLAVMWILTRLERPRGPRATEPAPDLRGVPDRSEPPHRER